MLKTVVILFAQKSQFLAYGILKLLMCNKCFCSEAPVKLVLKSITMSMNLKRSM